ncbi:MAG: 4Fe-4S dicluster domain-containing protein [Chloroflexi bacterium]|nr:4Fe-4S dicluster domain-containing protein [Chloroflexota bacterium]
MARLGMVIDLKRCIGCYSCVAACKAENGTPPGVFWGRVLEKEEGKFPATKRTFLPVLCNHCQEPACLRVCPTGATSQRPDGIVLIDYKKCIGCRACMAACPYQTRYYLNSIQPYYPLGFTPFEERKYQKFQRGVVTKCTFCPERLDQGLEPACVQTCITGARYFGDLADPASQVSRLLRERYAFRLLPEAGTEPSVYYLA